MVIPGALSRMTGASTFEEWQASSALMVREASNEGALLEVRGRERDPALLERLRQSSKLWSKPPEGPPFAVRVESAYAPGSPKHFGVQKRRTTLAR
eukprot:CAMPEP_0177323440 /NCGR_PEP_ID=MMETSP0368-20130122/16745_1 /TAXON_ID=447022 ORGANISM="Scrippsiella hangoei-like, Strain SHHI-4" /NCGR_SAMPLE_ID=MMETSP0368 /ASSEMBLY_ACC=CAM_ASM_000363 /LENGTH=95 /DNA_ID=CAMNT_0018783209 /DNA_START=361 /DNA_END=649 /DNA_ORIENTATION=+